MIVLSRHITRGPPRRGVTYDWGHADCDG